MIQVDITKRSPLKTSNFLSLMDLLGLKKISLKLWVTLKLYTTRAHLSFLASMEILSGRPSSIASTSELCLFMSPIGVFSMKYPQIDKPIKLTSIMIINVKIMVCSLNSFYRSRGKEYSG